MSEALPIVLGGYAAKQCPRRVHNDFDPTIPKVRWEPPAELQARFDAGTAFEARVFEAIESTLGRRCARIEAGLDRASRIEATIAAMREGYAVILEGQLPNDEVGGRVGKPDVLVRWPGPNDRPMYVPADVKHHRMAKPSMTKSLAVSSLNAPDQVQQLPGRVAEIAARIDDQFQLAHYTRMIQAAGFHPGDDALIGAIIGSDELFDVDASGHAFVWYDLSVPAFKTFSRSAGTKKRSALERYDHEHAFRVRVAEVARSRSGVGADPAPLVIPVWQQECDVCPWAAHCAEALGPDAASTDITTGRLDVREWLALHDAGISTTSALAEIDPDDPTLHSQYLPRVTHQPKAVERLRSVVQRAQMIRDGITLVRSTGFGLDIPRADVEVDLDIEWDVENRVYLWGARTLRDGQVTYDSFVSWDRLAEDSERVLAQGFADWLRSLIADARADGRTVAVYHYAHPEPLHLRRILGAEAEELIAVFVDLLPFMRDNFVGVHGLSIKKVAPAFGFDWRDVDPGGLQSQGWLVAARSSPDSRERETARARLLEYNEDDVGATAAIRAGLQLMEAEGRSSI